MADASVLGIHPPSTVRIDLDGWINDWPFEWVQIAGDRVIISPAGRPVIYYPYEHARENADGWTFHGRQAFTVCAAAPQVIDSLN